MPKVRFSVDEATYKAIQATADRLGVSFNRIAWGLWKIMDEMGYYGFDTREYYTYQHDITGCDGIYKEPAYYASACKK